MREDVVIVLNEREPLKRQMAGELSDQLGMRAIAQHRIKPEGDLAEVIRIRRPKVLVLDYILGDVGTALDILARFRLDPAEDTKIIVWTDEPSVSAAVTALKLGAYDYIEMVSSRSLERVLRSIEEAIESFPAAPHHKPLAERLSPAPPVGECSVFKRCLNLIEGQAHTDEPAAVLLGPRGSGRNRLAEYFHHCRPNAGAYLAVDYDLFSGKLEQIIGAKDSRRIVPWLSNGATVFIDHAEFDGGELLEAVELLQQSPSELADPAGPVLIVGTSSAPVAASWARILDCRVHRIPALTERPEDFFPLLNYFAGRLNGNSKSSRPDLSPALIQRLVQLEWPGNVRQLRAAAIDIFSLGAREGAAAIYDLVCEAKERWERFDRGSETSLNPFLIRKALAESGGNFRIAAARLGAGVQQIHRLLDAGKGDPP